VTTPENPYAAALDGLTIEDPVRALFDFCREREAIRLRREAGQPGPWSTDPIFQQGRFLNVFREDDRGSRAIRRFVEPVVEDLPALVQALFFARWCNRQSTLDALNVGLLEDPVALRAALHSLAEPPWCNATAYPVEAVRYEGRSVSRFAAATRLFLDIRHALTDALVGAGGDAVRATAAVNAMLGMANPFPISLAVIDLADFRPDCIDPESPVHAGIGATPYLDRLQSFLGEVDYARTMQRVIELQPTGWPEAKRALKPIDVEYLCCECRKYFSYVNGTKTFTGKNRFRPSESPRLRVEIPTPPAGPVRTRIHVLAGGPCSGKSTLLEALRQAGHRVVRETSQRLLEAGIAEGRTAEELRADPLEWQQRVLLHDHALFEGLPVEEPVFTDTSVIEDIVYATRAGLEVGPNLESWLRSTRYAKVFFLEPLDHFERTEVRLESAQLARQLSDEVRACYRGYGYELISVPATPLAQRLRFILSEADLSPG